MSEGLKQKIDFMTANDELMKTKLEKKTKQDQEKHKERMNYFPFTHGDALEKQRQALNELQRKDLNDMHEERVEKSAERQKEKREQAMENKERQENRHKRHLELQEFQDYLEERHMRKLTEKDPSVSLD